MSALPSPKNEATQVYRIELERRIFGWMLRCGREFNAIKHADEARDLITTFHAPHDRIAAAIFAAADDGADTSAAAIALRLANDDALKELEGIEYLRDWAFGAPTVISEVDLQRQMAFAIKEYRAILERMDLEDRAEGALNAIRSGDPSAFDMLADLSRSASDLAASRNIVAKPFQYRPPEEIPTRQWLFGRHAIRGFISATAAAGGTGKTALAIAECLALVTGKNLLHDHPLRRHRAWYLGLEDPLEEYERRIGAAMLLHKLRPEEVTDGLFINSGRGGEFVIASEDRAGLFINRPAVAAIKRSIRDNNIALLTVDPFVACHTIAESDNTKIAAVAREWANIADETGCAIELIHHVRKAGASQEASADDLRGASAFVNAARSVRLLSAMTKEEAERADISPKDRYRYFRVGNAKANLTFHSDDGVWRELQSMTLRNGNGGKDDEVAAAQHWALPEATAIAGDAEREAIIRKLASGDWRADNRAAAWAGNAVAEILGVDPTDKANKFRVKRALDGWVRDGYLSIVTRQDSKRMSRQFIIPAQGGHDAQDR